jgi:hypothetical protein
MFSSLGHNWPLAVGAALTIPAAIMAINAGRHVPRPGLAAAPAE